MDSVVRTLQLRKKTPKRRVSAKGREDRVVATAANECWSMDFLSDGDGGKGGRGCVDRIVRLASCRFALTLWARCCCRFLPVISAMHSELRAAIMRHAVSDRGVRRERIGGDTAEPLEELHATPPSRHLAAWSLTETLPSWSRQSLALQLILPLAHHAGRSGNQDVVDAAAEQQLAHHQAGLDGFARAHVVGDQQVHASQPQRLAEREKLVGIEPDPGPEWRLK